MIADEPTRMADAGVPTMPPGAAPPTAAAPAEFGVTIPEDALILITTRNLVLFPGTVLPMTLGRQRSVVAAQTSPMWSRNPGTMSL